MDAFQYLLSLEKFGIKFGLANIRALCAALGQPQASYRSVLIAGTNGKGSVTAMVDCGLRAAGLKVGRYTSPHLVRLEERFSLDGKPVATATLAAAIERVRRAVDRLLAEGTLEAPPTFFEVTTAVAFEIFREAGVAFSVLEVGLGGRLDATNAVEPVAGAITSIAFDHEQYLGHTLAAIAGEKAGIIRKGIPIVIGPLGPEAFDVVHAACASKGALAVDAMSGIDLLVETDGGRTSIKLKTDVADYGWVQLGLRGAHQIPNAVVAVRMLEQLSRLTPIDSGAIIAGIRDVQWPGRLEVLEASNGRRLLIDAAHNPAGASALAAYIEREFAAPIPFVFGAMRDKDAATMLEILRPVASALVVTQPSNSRAREADELASLARRLLPGCPVDVEPDPGSALERAWRYGSTICVAGSIFLIGDVLERLGTEVRHS